jgi:phosphoglycerate dehydrogenase-like enzyme
MGGSQGVVFVTRRILCLRPEADFLRVGVTPPAGLAIDYRAPADGDVPDLVRSADALVIPAVGTKLPAELFRGSTARLVQVTGAGVDRLDREALIALGIPVANVPGGSNAAVAEYATTTAALLLRRLAWASREIRRGHYAEFRQRLLLENVGGLAGALVGIVGLGTIGMAVARAFHAQGCRIVHHDPKPVDPDGAEKLGATPLELSELLGTADIVSLHVPLLPATGNLIGAAELKTMKPGAILIQASRGGGVDEQALADALVSGPLGGAAVDVYSTEPPALDNPLLALSGEAAERAILTPHIAGVTRQASEYLFRAAWENVARVVLRGEAPLNRVY